MSNDNSDDNLRAAKAVRGRGTGEVPKGRFERLEVAYVPEDAAQVETQVFKDRSKSVLSTNDSPDIGFTVSLNPYRGCEHGCIYCYARPTHEYLGLSAGLDFESKIFAKTDAPGLLRKALEAKSWTPQVVVMSGVTDCYQPIERELKLTRQCLEVLAEFRNPGVIITKNALVARDIDVLQKLAQYNAIQVVISITTLDKELARHMEPRASRPDLRFDTVEKLAKADIPVSVNMAPIVPGLTDSEIPAILKRASECGARSAHYTLVRLPYGVKDLFQTWLDEHYPTRKNKVLNHIKDTRSGKLYSAEFGKRMKGEGVYADQIAQMFSHWRKHYGLDKPWPGLTTEYFKRQDEKQMSLF